MLALTFENKLDYDKIEEDDTFNFIDLDLFYPGKQIEVELVHNNSSSEIILCNHTFNEAQINWFKAGSALNLIRSNQSMS